MSARYRRIGDARRRMERRGGQRMRRRRRDDIARAAEAVVEPAPVAIAAPRPRREPHMLSIPRAAMICAHSRGPTDHSTSKRFGRNARIALMAARMTRTKTKRFGTPMLMGDMEQMAKLTRAVGRTMQSAIAFKRASSNRSLGRFKASLARTLEHLNKKRIPNRAARQHGIQAQLHALRLPRRAMHM